MNILGISGLHHSISFKRAHWATADEREYRISQGHDAAAALLVDGEIVAAAAEERFDRVKASPAFPAQAMRYCLRQANLSVSDVDEVAHCFDYTPYESLFARSDLARQRFREVYSRDAVLRCMGEHFGAELPGRKLFQVEHHWCHAASVHLTSGWQESVVLVLDGMGEFHSVSAWRATNAKLVNLDRLTLDHSIGIFYSLVTLHLGFEYNSDEYKIMGLAPYGDPARFRAFFADAVQLTEGGRFRIPCLTLNRSPEEFENWLATRQYLTEHLGPARRPDEEIGCTHRDIAAGLQECLNNLLLHLARHYRRKTGLTRLGLAGGVALNCTANGELLRSGIFDDVYVQPAAGDDGAALGAALARAQLHGEVDNRRLPAPLLGPAYDQARVKAALAAFAGKIHVESFESLDETCRAAAQLVADGRVLAWHRNRMEFGPRALGNRSILADPSRPDMRDRINAMVKKREGFRPFAPAVALEEVDTWFEVAPQTALPHMIFVVGVRPEHRKSLPAITHVNGTARVQTVSRADNSDFYTLLQHVGQRTGRKMLLNTSFNVKGQPIVNTPEEAIDTFLRTAIDALFLGDHLVRKNSQT